MSAGYAVVGELMPDRLPCLAAILGALDLLSKPTAGLRGVKPVRVNWRSFQVINFPPREVRTADFPICALAIGSQDKGAFAGTNE